MTVALVLVILGLTGCTNNTFTRIGFPDPITEQGKTVVTIWQGSWIAGMAVGILVWGMILWAVIFHRKRGDRLPPQARYNMPIEIMYTAVPFVLIAVLFYYTAKDENYLDAISPKPQVQVNVLGFQWSWQFKYPQYHVTRRRQHVWERPAAGARGPDWGDGRVQPDLRRRACTPSGSPSSCTSGTSSPIIRTTSRSRLTKTGTFLGHCSELCGVYHSRMLFTLKVVTPQQFQADMAAKQAAQQTSGSAQ